MIKTVTSKNHWNYRIICDLITLQWNCQCISVMCIDLWIFVWSYAQNTVFLHQLILDFFKYKYHNASFFSWLAKVIVFHGLAHLCLFTLYENWATVLVELLPCRWDAPVTSQTTFAQLCPSPVCVCVFICVFCVIFCNLPCIVSY